MRKLAREWNETSTLSSMMLSFGSVSIEIG
jgi:hypothetical protein